MYGKVDRLLICIILITFATSPVLVNAKGTALNHLLIVVMCLSPIVLLAYHKLAVKDICPLLLIFFVVANPLLFHPETLRWGTILFTVLYCLTFMAYSRLINDSGFALEKYARLLKYIIYAYALVLIIQQFCVLSGLPIFLSSNYDSQTLWKLNSLTSEPSHSVRYVALLMYSYMTMKECVQQEKYTLFKGISQDKWLWIAFLWVMIMSFSATGILFLFIVLTKFINKKNWLSFVACFLLLLLLLNATGSSAFERAYQMVKTALTLDEYAMVQADHSGSARIVPMIICAKMINLAVPDGWIGHGVDYVSTWMYLYYPGVADDYTAGGILSFCIEYGFIPFLVFIYFSFSTVVRRHDFTSLLFWFFMCLNEGINMQLTWAAILFMYTNKVLIQQYSIRNQPD